MSGEPIVNGHHLCWEVVSEENADPNATDIETRRARVPGGWLYRCVWQGNMTGHVTMAMTFVPRGAG